MEDALFTNLRQRMVAEIAAEAALTVKYTGRPAFAERVMQVMAKVPRHEFVPAEIKAYGYLNRPLPIGCDKTVSQPFIVALMTDLLDLAPEDVALEIGAGAGYQAAVLAELVRKVYTIDIIAELAEGAERRLRQMKYANVTVRVGNGYYGWAEHGPYDKIMVTAACELVPPPLIAQLKPGGRMIIPTGITERQILTLVEKSAEGKVATRDLLPVRFSELEEPEAIAGRA
jgi:protein-L-isoaspartate(D-aspartate) O-methyltransferase